MAISATAIAASPTQTTVYSSSGQTAITTLIFCNTNAYNSSSPTANTVNLTLYLVPTGSSANSTNMIVNQLPIPAGETFTFDTEKVVMASGDFVVAVGSVAGLSCTISYMSV